MFFIILKITFYYIKISDVNFINIVIKSHYKYKNIRIALYFFNTSVIISFKNQKLRKRIFYSVYRTIFVALSTRVQNVETESTITSILYSSRPIRLQIFCTLAISNSYRTVPSTIWRIFSEFLIFCNLFHEPLGE